MNKLRLCLCMLSDGRGNFVPLEMYSLMFALLVHALTFTKCNMENLNLGEPALTFGVSYT
jgi:hypothetical protein